MLKVVERIDKQVGSLSSRNTKQLSEADLRTFISRLCALSDIQAKNEAYVLSLKEMITIVDYITTNRFKFTIHPLVIILKERRNTQIFLRLMKQWKTWYAVSEINEVLDVYFSDDKWMSTTKVTPITKDLWKTWMTGDDNCAINIARYLVKNQMQPDDLVQYQITNHDAIYQGVRNALILVCPQQQYYELNPQMVLDALKVFDQPRQHLFLQNFLIPLPDQKLLARYSRICEWIDKQYPFRRGSEKKAPFWQASLPDEINGFARWNLLCDIRRLFGRDERSMFWLDFIDVLEDVRSVQTKPNEFRIALYFKRFVVIEFTQIGFAAHIIDMDQYKRYLADYFEIPYDIKDSELRSRIKDLYLSKDRIIHRVGWQSNAYNKIYSLL